MTWSRADAAWISAALTCCKRALRAEVARLETRAKVSASAATVATARAATADEKVRTLTAAVEAHKSEVARLEKLLGGAKPAQTSRVAPVSGFGAPKTPLRKPAAGEPAKPWSPWGS